MAILKKEGDHLVDYTDALDDEKIAPVEDDYASQSYGVGDLLIHIGYLYRVTVPINKNDEILIGVNITPTTLAREMQNVDIKIDHACVPGTMQMFGGTTIPDGYLLCDGREVSRTEYADLFAAIGTTWGEGDHSTTFNVPDMREVAPVGIGTSSRNEPAHDAFLLGEFKDDQLQSHTHSYTAAANSSGTVGVGSYPNGNCVGAHYTFSTNGVNTGRSGTVTRGKRIGVNFIIKY